MLSLCPLWLIFAIWRKDMGEDIKWVPYLEKMKEQIDQLKLSEIKEWEGRDLTPASEFKTPKASGGFKAYSTDKIDKIGIGTLYLNEEVHYGFCAIFPDENHSLPIFISRWEEREKEIKFLVDIMPSVDSLIDEEYRKKYVESVQPLWERFASLPGICPEESDVIRSLCSIIYTAARVPIDKEGMRLAALAPHTEYLKSYLAFLKEATPIENDAKREEVKKKREAIRGTLRTKFFKEVMKDSIESTVGSDLSELIVTILF
jgi:hypothetical protein